MDMKGSVQKTNADVNHVLANIYILCFKICLFRVPKLQF